MLWNILPCLFPDLFFPTWPKHNLTRPNSTPDWLLHIRPESTFHNKPSTLESWKYVYKHNKLYKYCTLLDPLRMCYDLTKLNQIWPNLTCFYKLDPNHDNTIIMLESSKIVYIWRKVMKYYTIPDPKPLSNTWPEHNRTSPNPTRDLLMALEKRPKYVVKLHNLPKYVIKL